MVKRYSLQGKFSALTILHKVRCMYCIYTNTHIYTKTLLTKLCLELLTLNSVTSL